jgi:hypothetical protein
MLQTSPNSCPCLDHGPKYPSIECVRDVGVDKTKARFADVEVVRCTVCGRLWLSYHVEYEFYSRSGRWAEGLIDEATAAAITPEEAAEYLHGLDWYVYGGSWFGHGGKRGSGPMGWGPMGWD